MRTSGVIIWFIDLLFWILADFLRLVYDFKCFFIINDGSFFLSQSILFLNFSLRFYFNNSLGVRPASFENYSNDSLSILSLFSDIYFISYFLGILGCILFYFLLSIIKSNVAFLWKNKYIWRMHKNDKLINGTNANNNIIPLKIITQFIDFKPLLISLIFYDNKYALKLIRNIY